MADDYRAVVVGLQHYPLLDPDPDSALKGPENDAKDFYAWVTSKSGGGVCPDNAKLILSSNYPPAQIPGDSLPTTIEVHRAFERLQDVAEESSRAGNGLRVGQRLYVYFAGHGFAPREDHTALLMANASRNRPGYHVLGTYVANWFRRAAYFDEVLLFMDCCREDVKVPALNMPWQPRNAPDAVERVKRFHAFGTKWSRLSRERKMEDNEVHGVFTRALLTGLKGAAVDPVSRTRITAGSLGTYLTERLKDFLAKEDLENPDIPKAADVDFDQSQRDTFVVATVAKQTYPVKLSVPDDADGKELVIRDDKFKKIKTMLARAPDMTLPLGRGTYLALLEDGREAVIEVNGTGGVHVTIG